MTRALRLAGGLAAAALLLLLPLAIPPADSVLPPASPEARPFVWGRDSAWRALEARFADARTRGCADSAASWAALDAMERRLEGMASARLTPEAPAFDSLEADWFGLAPEAAACAPVAVRYVAAQARLREAVKRQSIGWDVKATPARDRLYRALYGGRAAVEEVMLQQGAAVPTLLAGHDEPSATPSAVSNGVRLHSGDILVSRGGYPTSALIARGNDYPGNFSHIALVHIDSATGAITVVEAHIELGVAITTADGYLADKKLRLMVLRPRADLPAMVADPLLPHKAATAMLARARAGHIPYDFAMDYTDPSRLFCSEVASQAYRAEGLPLWMGLSTISRPGLRQWLGSFGVRHFATQEPSDLEYDPQVTVVAEWRDAAALFEDHIDNAVTDAMLEGAERGDRLTYPWYQLPMARLLKGWSWVVQRTGRPGTIPEGMAPAAALRNRGYGARHDALAAEVRTAAESWRAERGYAPPYWVLLELARAAAAN
jgi:Permuted papain-like amidase enzyme, YaeF/YiiX, C92 family